MQTLKFVACEISRGDEKSEHGMIETNLVKH